MCGKCIPITTKTANALHNFSHWLQVRMKASDTTDAELAQYVGCERKTIMEIRNGRKFPKMDQLVMIFDFFDKNMIVVPFNKEFEDYGN